MCTITSVGDNAFLIDGNNKEMSSSDVRSFLLKETSYKQVLLHVETMKNSELILFLNMLPMTISSIGMDMDESKFKDIAFSLKMIGKKSLLEKLHTSTLVPA